MPYNSQSSFSLRYLHIPNDTKSASNHTRIRSMIIFSKVILHKLKKIGKVFLILLPRLQIVKREKNTDNRRDWFSWTGINKTVVKF